MSHVYAFGDEFSPQEYVAAFQTFFKRPPTMAPQMGMSRMAQLNRNRLEHEVNRCRLMAFDSNKDDGFSHTVTGGYNATQRTHGETGPTGHGKERGGQAQEDSPA